jgi:hypothetical protein
MTFDIKQLFIGIALLICTNTTFGQKLNFKCVALYNETHEPLNHVQMQLVCKRASYKGVDYDTIRSVTDEKGFASFDKVLRPGATQFILYCADKNYKQFHMPIENDTSKINVYFVMDKASDEYFPEFYFDDNSTVLKDTSTFGKIDFKQLTSSRKVQLSGYVAPNENTALATKRIEAVMEGLMDRGKASNNFVIKTVPLTECVLQRGMYIRYNQKDYFFKKGEVINKTYIDQQVGDRKYAALQILRTVQLNWVQ